MFLFRLNRCDSSSGLLVTIADLSRILLSEPLVALTRRGVTFAWTDEQQVEFETLKACLLQAPILGFPTEDGLFILDTDASLFAAQPAPG